LSKIILILTKKSKTARSAKHRPFLTITKTYIKNSGYIAALIATLKSFVSYDIGGAYQYNTDLIDSQ